MEKKAAEQSFNKNQRDNKLQVAEKQNMRILDKKSLIIESILSPNGGHF